MYRLIKVAILCILAVGIVVIYAGQQYKIEYSTSKRGEAIFTVINMTSYPLYCALEVSDGYYKPFDIRPQRASQWFLVPRNKWIVTCEG